jgi:MFS family permease
MIQDCEWRYRPVIACRHLATLTRYADTVFESLRIRSFRYQWAADTFGTWAAETETLLLGWYVLVDTGSPFLVGVVGALRFGGTLLAPLYGVLADRRDRKTLLITLRAVQVVMAAAIAVLALAGALRPWHAFAIAGMGGLIRNGENVVRQSLLADGVPSGALLNAVGLSRITQDLAKILGAVAGAALLAHLGMGAAYLAVTTWYLLSTVTVLGVAPERRVARPAEGAYATLRAGARYMWHSQPIQAIMFLAFLVNLTAFPLTNGLMPVVARDLFRGGPEVLALLLSATSVGALAGSFGLVALPRLPYPERTMTTCIVVWHGLLLAFAPLGAVGAASPWGFALCLAVLAAYGAATSGAMVTMSSVLLGTAEIGFRGRVMGVRMMAVYGLPLGLLLGGYLSEQLGVPRTLTLLGVLGLALTIGAAFRWPAVLHGRPTPTAAPPEAPAAPMIAAPALAAPAADGTALSPRQPRSVTMP